MPMVCRLLDCYEVISLYLNFLHDVAISPLRREKGQLSNNDMLGRIVLEKNGRTIDFFPGEVSTDRINAIQVILLQLPQYIFFAQDS